jgi:hypothetical protein
MCGRAVALPLPTEGDPPSGDLDDLGDVVLVRLLTLVRHVGDRPVPVACTRVASSAREFVAMTSDLAYSDRDLVPAGVIVQR